MNLVFLRNEGAFAGKEAEAAPLHQVLVAGIFANKLSWPKYHCDIDNFNQALAAGSIANNVSWCEYHHNIDDIHQSQAAGIIANNVS